MHVIDTGRRTWLRRRPVWLVCLTGEGAVEVRGTREQVDRIARGALAIAQERARQDPRGQW